MREPTTELARVKTKNQLVLDYLQANPNKDLTLAEISAATGVREGTVGSRIRDLRTFGYNINRHHLGGGVHGYNFPSLR